MTNNIKECAVYFLVEPTHFKIGLSVSVADRAKKVTPELIKEKSWAAFFDSPTGAKKCEGALHRIFYKKRLPAIRRDGGTELFDISCLEEVENFVLQNKQYLGYSRIVKSPELFPILQISQAERDARKEKERIREEKEAAARAEIIANNKRKRALFIETFNKLKNSGCILGVSDEIKNYPSLFCAISNEEEDQWADILSKNSTYYDCITAISILFDRDYALNNLLADETLSIEKTFGKPGVYKMHIFEIGCPRHEETKLAFLSFSEKTLEETPFLEGDKFDCVNSIINPPTFPAYGIHIVEEDKDCQIRHVLFDAHALPDSLAQTKAHEFWDKTLKSQASDNGEWRYAIYDGRNKEYKKICDLGLSNGSQRYLDTSMRKIPPHRLTTHIALSEDEYITLTLKATRYPAWHQIAAHTKYGYYDSSGYVYVAGNSPKEAYQNLLIWAGERDFTIVDC